MQTGLIACILFLILILRVACGVSKPLPFRQNYFDTDVLEHIPEPQNTWTELNRILKPGGKVLISVPFFYWLHEIPYDYYRYTEHALKRFARMAKLEVLVLEQYGGALEILTDITAKNIIQIHWRFGPFLADKIQQLCLWYGQHKQYSESEKTPFPLGYFMVVQK